MNDRQKEILAFVIHEYIKSAQPVGSALLTEKAGLELSPATYRNELAALEAEGYLIQPHTSAGRVPTEKAYQSYAAENLEKLTFNPTKKGELKVQLKKEFETNEILKQVAKKLVEQSHETVIVAFGKDSLYYTGLSNLFAKPEFSSQEQVVSLSTLVDNMDELVGGMFDKVKDLEVLIGASNPFGSQCATIIGKYHLKGKGEGMFAILGPMRMDYRKNIGLLQQVTKLIEDMNNEK